MSDLNQKSKMTPIERLGIGLGVMGIGIALFVGLPPPWWSDMPPALIHFGVALGIALIFVGAGLVLNSAWGAARQGRNRMLPLIGMAVFGVGFLGCGAWYFWPGKLGSSTETSPLDGAIQISSDLAAYPNVMPPNKMFELQLNNHFMMQGGAFLNWSQPAGAALPVRDPTIMPSNGVRLRVSNYGKTAIINTRVAFLVNFLAAHKTESGMSSGEVIKAATLTTNPFSMAPGEIVDIYAMNYSTDAFAEVMIPETAQGFAPGSDKQEIFKLIPPIFAGMAAFPFVPKSPPAPPPQAQSPSNKQGKK